MSVQPWDHRKSWPSVRCPSSSGGFIDLQLWIWEKHFYSAAPFSLERIDCKDFLASTDRIREVSITSVLSIGSSCESVRDVPAGWRPAAFCSQLLPPPQSRSFLGVSLAMTSDLLRMWHFHQTNTKCPAIPLMPECRIMALKPPHSWRHWALGSLQSQSGQDL